VDAIFLAHVLLTLQALPVSHLTDFNVIVILWKLIVIIFVIDKVN
jgi:hypothetical protein